MSKTDAEKFDDEAINELQKGSVDGAMSLFAKAIESDPTNPEYYTHRGFAYFGMQKFDNALEDFNKALELQQKNASVQSAVGIIYDFKKDWKKSFKYHERATWIDPNNETYWGLLRHCKTRLGEEKKTYLEFVEYLDNKSEEYSSLVRSPQFYHFLDEMDANPQACVNYLGSPILDLFFEFMMGGENPFIGFANMSIPVDEAREHVKGDNKKEGEKDKNDKNKCCIM